MPTRSGEWWRRAVVYQVYIRSFADGDGDGVGDIAGIRTRLGYLSDLGVDALWIQPWYRSPMADGGYDVADYRAIDPLFGTIEEAQALIDEAHGLGLRVLADIVPNHTSDQHAWFQAALASPPGSRERRRYHFRDGRGPGGSEPPNDWRSVFGGDAWSRVSEADGRPGQWYLHLFAPQQPDLDWSDPEVAEEFESILDFWFRRGLDGFRIDVAHGLAKDPTLPDLGGAGQPSAGEADEHPHWDREAVHEIYRGWRRVADRYPEGRIFVGEVHVMDPRRRARYLRGDELHSAFEFDFMWSPWEAGEFRARIDGTRAALGAAGAPATWGLSNHDLPRHVTRFGRAYTGLPRADRLLSVPFDFGPTDLALGTRRARAAALLALALPGTCYLYQGEELGLWEVEDLPASALQDPVFVRTGGAVRGRDGCRVPLPWSGTEPPFGFGPPGTTAWLPQPVAWAGYTAGAEATDPESMLSLYRVALRVRREHPGLAGDDFEWLDAGRDVLAFERGAGFGCVVNLGEAPVPVPADSTLVLASLPLADGRVPVDAAAWYVRAD